MKSKYKFNENTIIMPSEAQLKYWKSLIGKPSGMLGKSAFWAKNNPQTFKKGHKINLGRKRIDITGKNHWNWNGDNISYNKKHEWIRKTYGNPLKCDDCGKFGEKINGEWNIDWSNNNHTYSRNIDDYRGRCVKCHRAYDKKFNKK